MPITNKFGSVAQATTQYDNFMKRYGGAYDRATLPNEEIRTAAFRSAVQASSLKDEAMVYNVLTECVSRYISAEDPRERDKNIQAFNDVLFYSSSMGLLEKAEPEQILSHILDKFSQAMGAKGRKADRPIIINEKQAKNLIKMGKELCKAASLKGENADFIKQLEEITKQYKKTKEKSKGHHHHTRKKVKQLQ